MKRRSLWVRLAVVALLLAGMAMAQEKPAAEPKVGAAAEQKSEPRGAGEQAAAAEEHGTGNQLAEESKEAAEGDKFKHSPMVRKIASALHIPIELEYWIFYGLDFAAIFLAIAWMMKAKLPSFFRTRNEEIQRSMKEATKVTEEARARLGEIESRLARIDTEVAAMRTQAEHDAQAEEARIKASVEEDKQRIIAAAEQEIAAAAKVAQRDLKAYAASLAVDLAESKIKIDANTDRALVRSFGADFGKDGR